MNKPSSPYFRGARAALFLGPYLCLIFLSLVIHLPAVQLIGSLMILALPVVTAARLRRSFVSSGYRYTYSELWVEGIAMYLFACAICALFTMVYLKWIDPGVLMRMTADTITQLQAVGTPEYRELARVLRNALNEGLVLRPSSFVMSMFWLTMTIGCLTSMLLAPLVRLRRPPQPQTK